jgi:DNA-binding transcriptional LysR family regulator
MLDDVRRLRALEAIADLESFSEAAVALGYTQSAVSQQIVALEEQVGLTVVERTRPPRLTEAGRVLLEHAAPVFEHLATVDAKLDAIRGLRTGRVRVAAFSSAYSTFAAPAIADFSSDHPDVEVVIEVSEPTASVPRLKRGEFDLAIVFDWSNVPDAPDPRLEQRHLVDDDLVVILPVGHALAGGDSVRVADLANEGWIVPHPRGPAAVYWRMLDGLAADSGFAPRVAHELDDLAATQAFVAAGLGVALMNRLTLPAERGDLAVRPLADIRITRRIWAATVKGRRWPASDRLAEALSRSAKSLATGTRRGD